MVKNSKFIFAPGDATVPFQSALDDIFLRMIQRGIVTPESGIAVEGSEGICGLTTDSSVLICYVNSFEVRERRVCTVRNSGASNWIYGKYGYSCTDRY